jgi:hypothetical protein
MNDQPAPMFARAIPFCDLTRDDEAETGVGVTGCGGALGAASSCVFGPARMTTPADGRQGEMHEMTMSIASSSSPAVFPAAAVPDEFPRAIERREIVRLAVRDLLPPGGD